MRLKNDQKFKIVAGHFLDVQLTSKKLNSSYPFDNLRETGDTCVGVNDSPFSTEFKVSTISLKQIRDFSLIN